MRRLGGIWPRVLEFENLLAAREKGRKTAATTFCFSPTILYAFDVVPVCLEVMSCLLYTSPSPRDGLLYRMPSSA